MRVIRPCSIVTRKWNVWRSLPFRPSAVRTSTEIRTPLSFTVRASGTSAWPPPGRSATSPRCHHRVAPASRLAAVPLGWIGQLDACRLAPCGGLRSGPWSFQVLERPGDEPGLRVALGDLGVRGGAEQPGSQLAPGVVSALGTQHADAALDLVSDLVAQQTRGLVLVLPARESCGVDRLAEPEVQALRARQDRRPDPTCDGRHGQPDQALHQVGDRGEAGRRPIGDDMQRVLDPDGGERHDRVAELDRQPREAKPLLPDQLVPLVRILEHLTGAAGEHQHMLARPHQLAHVLPRAAHHARQLQQVAPDRDRVVRVLTETADREVAPLPQLGHRERQVEQAVEGVVADDQHAAVIRDVVDADDLRLRDARQRGEDRCEAVHVLRGRGRGDSRHHR